MGIVATTVVSQLERRRAEQALAAIADAVLPAAQYGRDAGAAFQRVVEAYTDTFLMDDRAGLDRATLEGSRALESLYRIGATTGISAERASSAQQLAATLTEFLADANRIYGSSPSLRQEMTPETAGGRRRRQRWFGRTGGHAYRRWFGVGSG
jgi:hypothetical protein